MATICQQRPTKKGQTLLTNKSKLPNANKTYTTKFCESLVILDFS